MIELTELVDAAIVSAMHSPICVLEKRCRLSTTPFESLKLWQVRRI
jgi:hypothetical protein